MNKKSQAAMEFLMTYGWAILVVLIAIGLLAYFGVLNPNKLRGNQTTGEVTEEICEKYCNEVEDMDFESCSVKGDEVSVTCVKGDSRKRVRLTRIYLLSLQ